MLISSTELAEGLCFTIGLIFSGDATIARNVTIVLMLWYSYLLSSIVNSVKELSMYVTLQCQVMASPRQCSIELYSQLPLQNLTFPSTEYSSAKGKRSSSVVYQEA